MRWIAIIVVALILLAVWAASIFFPDLRWVAWAVTGAVLFLIIAIVFVVWLRKRLKAAAIEREMMKQAAAGADDPDKRPEILALRAEMHRAVQALKRQRRGAGGGRSALYRLPWYVIVGPSAVGKTTALERSGLSFISNASGTPKIRGVAGTRNCDWWFSDEAILLDTAGRFATEEDDHDEWMAFLDMLRRLRPERPLDGLMVAVSAPDILAASESDRETLATKLRARLDEVLHRLEVVLPVYLVLTKVDLVAGFVEFWSDLGKPQRAQVWGASFDQDDPRRDDLGRAVEAEFDTLVQGLHGRLLYRLPAERNLERRTRIMQFPVELRALRSPLSHFAEALCRPSADRERPLLRGFYLTSATQVGRPVERILSGMVRGFDPHGRSSKEPGSEGEVHSYFLSDVFQSVILPDRSSTARSAAGVERRSRRELRAALVAFGGAALVLIPAVLSYVRNTQLVHDVDRAIYALNSAATTSVPGASDDPLEPMLDTLDRLDDEATGFSIPGWFGPRAARELRGPLRRAYLARIHSMLRLRVAKELDKDLSSIGKAKRLEDSTGSPEDHTPLRTAYESVKLSATLVEPNEHVELPWTAQQLARVWQRALAGGSAVGPERLLRHATNYLAALQADRDLRWPATPLLQEARGRLKEFGIGQLPYHWALRRAYDQPPILASDVADGASLKYLTCPAEQVLVRGQYTASAWQKIGPALDLDHWPSEAIIERWVIADMRLPKDEATLRAQVRDEYYDNYSQEWMSLLDKCAVSRPKDFESAKDELTALKDPKGFYRTLFSQFSGNVISDEKKEPSSSPLPLSTEGCVSKFAALRPDSAAPQQPKTVSAVRKNFQPLLVFSGDAEDAKKPAPLEKYATILETLRATLESASEAQGADPRPLFLTAKQGVEALLDGLQEPTKGKLNRLLMPPVDGTMKVTETGRVDSTSAEWKKKVWGAWDGKLSRLFPFNRGPSPREAANFEDFRSFFQPDGTLWSFVHANLADWVELSDEGYVAKPTANPLGEDLLSCLSIAQEITDAFFGVGEEPGLKLSLQVDWSAVDVTEAKFWIGEKATVLPKAQWSPGVKWNGEGVRLEWVQGGRPTQELGRHSFSLFDLFEQLGGLKPAGSGRRGMYVTEYPPLTVKVRSEGKKDALRADFFSRLQCPREIRMGKP
jgi:type VI secretion system protein ImpL